MIFTDDDRNDRKYFAKITPSSFLPHISLLSSDFRIPGYLVSLSSI